MRNEKQLAKIQLWAGIFQVLCGTITAVLAVMSLNGGNVRDWVSVGLALCVVSCIISLVINLKRVQLEKLRNEK